MVGTPPRMRFESSRASLPPIALVEQAAHVVAGVEKLLIQVEQEVAPVVRLQKSPVTSQPDSLSRLHIRHHQVLDERVAVLRRQRLIAFALLFWFTHRLNTGLS